MKTIFRFGFPTSFATARWEPSCAVPTAWWWCRTSGPGTGRTAILWTVKSATLNGSSPHWGSISHSAHHRVLRSGMEPRSDGFRPCGFPPGCAASDVTCCTRLPGEDQGRRMNASRSQTRRRFKPQRIASSAAAPWSKRLGYSCMRTAIWLTCHGTMWLTETAAVRDNANALATGRAPISGWKRPPPAVRSAVPAAIRHPPCHRIWRFRLSLGNNPGSASRRLNRLHRTLPPCW